MGAANLTVYEERHHKASLLQTYSVRCTVLPNFLPSTKLRLSAGDFIPTP